MRYRGYVFISLAAVCWGMIGPVARLAFAEGVGPMEVAFWRAGLAWLFFGTQAVAQRQLRMAVRDLPALLAFAVTGVALFYGAYQLAVNRGGAALASVLLYTAPAWVVVLARMIWREPVGRRKLLCLGMTLSGVALISSGGGSLDGSVSLSAVGFGLTAGFCYAMYYIFGKHFSGLYPAATLFFYMLPIGAALLFPWVDFAHKSPAAWAALAVLALLCTYAAYHFYYLGLRFLEPGRASITATLEPVVAAAVAFFWWQESFSTAGYAGSALILAAVLLMILDRPEKG
ncbi:MAG: DMT family transporter [Desulfobacterales bacterium]